MQTTKTQLQRKRRLKKSVMAVLRIIVIALYLVSLVLIDRKWNDSKVVNAMGDAYNKAKNLVAAKFEENEPQSEMVVTVEKPALAVREESTLKKLELNEKKAEETDNKKNSSDDAGNRGERRETTTERRIPLNNDVEKTHEIEKATQEKTVISGDSLPCDESLSCESEQVPVEDTSMVDTISVEAAPIETGIETQTQVEAVPVAAEPVVVAPEPVSNPIADIINSAPLTPVSCGSAGIDAYFASVIAQITTPQMSTYEKVKAIYDYLIVHTYYDGFIEYLSEDGSVRVQYPDDFRNAYSPGYWYGYATLNSGRGVCCTYALAFTGLCRHIGLNSYAMEGQTSAAGGGYTGHAWSMISINGIEYVFDAQLDDQFAGGGPIKYARFCKRYDEVPGAYIPEKVYYIAPF